MYKRYLQNFIALFLLLLTHRLPAQVKFSATADPSQIARDELVQLKLAVENASDVQQILPPSFKDFILVNGPSEEKGMTVVNGNVKKYIALNYLLKPKKPGRFTIPAATAIVEGNTYRSNTVTVEVSNAVSGNSAGAGNRSMPFGFVDPFSDAQPRPSFNDYILKKGENPGDKIRQNIFVKLETNKTSCYVGEPVIATYKLYTRLKSESNMTKAPSFNGFSVIDLLTPDNNEFHQEKLNGREYNVYTVRKVQVYPLQPGNRELEAAEIDNTVHFIRAEYASRQQDMMNDIFRDFADATIPAEGMVDEKVTLQNKPMTILVKPLPDANKPAGFGGAVGHFTITAALEKNNFSTDDAGLLSVTIAGEGNLQLVTAPGVRWPGGVDVFEPRNKDDLYKTTVPVSGRKIIEFPFTVSTPGNYTLPPVQFSYFDPKTASYKTISTDSLHFSVTRGTGKPARQRLITGNNSNNSDSLLNRFFSSRLRVVSTVAVLILIGLIVWLKLDRRKSKHPAVAAPVPVVTAEEETVSVAAEKINAVQQPLLAAEACLQEPAAENFYQVLNQSLKEFLSSLLHIPAGELNKKLISEEMDKRGVSNATSLELQQLMDEIEWQLYTPFAGATQKQAHYDKANELVQLLNTYRG